MKTITRIITAVAATAVAAGTLVALGAGSASAATPSVTIGGISRENAVDVKSKGSITTPTASYDKKRVVIDSRSHVVTKGKKTVVRSGTDDKVFYLKIGTYKMKTTYTYRTFTEIRTGRGWHSTTQSTGTLNSFNDMWDACGHTVNDEVAVCTIDGVKYRGQLESDQLNDDMWYNFTPKEVWSDGKVIGRNYSAKRTVDRTQAFNIKNSKVMSRYEYKKIKQGQSYAKVRKTVGGYESYEGRTWRASGHTYVVREWTDATWSDEYHAIEFRDGKVYAKSWS